MKCTPCKAVFVLFFLTVSACAQVKSKSTSSRPAKSITVDIDQLDKPSKSRQPLSPREIAANALQSLVLIQTFDRNHQPLALGSGFVLHTGEVATNFHVVEGASSVAVKLFGTQRQHPSEGVLAVDKGLDLAVLDVPTLSAPELAIRQSDPPKVGDVLYTLGNPEGLEGTFSQGLVSGFRELDGQSLIQISAPISAGSSGGPVMDEFGKAFGVTVATLRHGQNLNFAIPIKYLVSLPITPISQKFPIGGSVSNELGERLTSGVVGFNFIWDNQLYEYPDYSFSLRNTLNQSVTNIRYLVVFYDSNGDPLDTRSGVYNSIIPAGLAKRITGTVEKSVKMFTTKQTPTNGFLSELTPYTKLEIRVLDFRVVED